MEYAVETLSLTKIFSDWWGRARVYAVDDLNLKIRKNEVFGLLGPNGSGKTTTIRMLLGLLHPTKGKAIVLGGDGSDPKINARIGFLPEESYLYRYLSARETLDFYGRLFGLPGKLRKLRIEALLDMVGLKAVANRAVGTYSKGMARRIGLAQALINDPDLLILDEPTTGLDPIGTRQIKDLIIKLAERGKTILLCSHLLADVEDVCDRISILYGGKVQKEGRVEELLQQTNKRQITTGRITDQTIEKIRQLVLNENSDCEIASPMEKLETFFINTVSMAQKQAQPTSGAYSTTKIGDFLAQEKKVENILDNLVSAEISKERVAQEDITIQKVVPHEEASVEPDRQLLDELTGSAETQQAAPVTEEQQNEPDLPEPTESTDREQIKKDILDRLAGGAEQQDGDDEREDQSQTGGPGDA